MFELLKQKDVEFELRNYIKNPLELNEIKEIISNLADNIEEIIRKNKEFDYGCLNLNWNRVAYLRKSKTTSTTNYFLKA